MGKQIYVAPHLEISLFNVDEPVLGNKSYPIFGDDEEGVDLGKENIIVISDFPDDDNIWDLWAEDEDEE